MEQHPGYLKAQATAKSMAERIEAAKAANPYVSAGSTLGAQQLAPNRGGVVDGAAARVSSTVHRLTIAGERAVQLRERLFGPLVENTRAAADRPHAGNVSAAGMLEALLDELDAAADEVLRHIAALDDLL